MDKVPVGGKVVGKDGVGVGFLDFLLACMKRKGAEVVRLMSGGPYLDALRFLAIVLEHSVAGTEKCIGIEGFGHREGPVADVHGIHPVKGERVRILVFLVLAGEDVDFTAMFR